MKTVNFKNCASILILSFCHGSYALPLFVTPKTGTTLPTQVIAGQTASAFYTVSNNTGSVRSNNYVKYLPSNVSQVTSDSGIPDLCSSTFTLQPSGRSGSSCTLSLNVTGAVNGNDPDSHQHLFVCFPGGITCSGTHYPLNVSLVGNEIIAVGFGDNNTTNVPLIASTNLQANVWTQQALTLPSGITAGVLANVTCAGNTCVAVGEYLDTTSNNLPAALQSTDGGSTWSQQVLTPPGSFTQGYFDSVNCIANICTAVGSYFTNGGTQQFAVGNSTDGGITWSQQALPLLSTYTQGTLNSLSCSGSQCVAVGSYADTSSFAIAAIAYSADSGNTWSQQTLPLLSGVEDESLNGVSCSGTLCIAVGEYDTSSDQLPGVAVSNNGGISWTQTTLTLPSPYIDGILNSVYCNGNTCIAVGVYTVAGGSDAPFYPAIAVTTDGGNSWTQQVLTTIPSGFNSGLLESIQCNSNTCVAVGYFQDINFNTSSATAVSTDGGNTWSTQALVSPAGINTAALLGVS